MGRTQKKKKQDCAFQRGRQTAHGFYWIMFFPGRCSLIQCMHLL